MWLVILKYLGGAIITGVVSWGVAKVSANSEIKKLRETWAHEKEETHNADFDSMVSAVSEFIQYGALKSQINAAGKIGLCRSSATGELAEILDEMSGIISTQPRNQAMLKAKLDKAVLLKRGQKN